jgi:predicted amidophosphoribosyltransferase
VGRDRAQRLAGIEGTVAVVGEAPPRALVVDDVITTGATVAACAAALAAGGSESVAVLGYARTPGR